MAGFEVSIYGRFWVSTEATILVRTATMVKLKVECYPLTKKGAEPTLW